MIQIQGRTVFDSILCKGAWTAPEGVTFPAFTAGGAIDFNSQLLSNMKLGTDLDGNGKSLNSLLHVKIASGDLFIRNGGQIRGSASGANFPFIAVTAGGDEEVGRIYCTTTALTGRFKTGRLLLTPIAQHASPQEADVIYNSVTKKLNFWTGTAWEVVTSA